MRCPHLHLRGERWTILTTTPCLICRKTKRDYLGCLSLPLTTLYLAVYCWVSLCGQKSMGSVLLGLRVWDGRFLHAIGFFFAMQSQSTGVLGIFLPFSVRGRVHERFFFTWSASVDTVKVSAIGVLGYLTPFLRARSRSYFSLSFGGLAMPEEYVIGFVCSARQWRQLKSQSMGTWGGYFTHSLRARFFLLTSPTRRRSFWSVFTCSFILQSPWVVNLLLVLFERVPRDCSHQPS